MKEIGTKIFPIHIAVKHVQFSEFLDVALWTDHKRSIISGVRHRSPIDRIQDQFPSLVLSGARCVYPSAPTRDNSRGKGPETRHHQCRLRPSTSPPFFHSRLWRLPEAAVAAVKKRWVLLPTEFTIKSRSLSPSRSANAAGGGDMGTSHSRELCHILKLPIAQVAIQPIRPFSRQK